MSTPADSPPRPRARRCNADYRWTLPKAMAFLEALAHSGSVAEAARAVEMSRKAAYQLKARLAGGPLGEGFERARRQGLRARAERSRSRWEGPGLDVLTAARQSYAAPQQGDTTTPQGDAQSAAIAPKVTVRAAR